MQMRGRYAECYLASRKDLRQWGQTYGRSVGKASTNVI